MWKRAQHKQIREQNEGILLVAKILNEEFLLFIVAEYAWDNVALLISRKFISFNRIPPPHLLWSSKIINRVFEIIFSSMLLWNIMNAYALTELLANISKLKYLSKTSSSLLFDYENFWKKNLKNIPIATKNLCYRFYFQQHLFCIFASKQRHEIFPSLKQIWRIKRHAWINS